MSFAGNPVSSGLPVCKLNKFVVVKYQDNGTIF